ncbi:hypothetical protein ACEZDB_35055 [Streptacidiphilus sp. N1-3]|uniref:Septum formation initiator n=1 Tax=Streptacidiphilus alkalitolerans TaxID=3342712 RepID=A0ABV6XCT4_9ACTN
MAVGRVADGTSPVRRRPGVPAARPGGRSGGRSGVKGRAAGRGPFAALVVLILAGGLIGLLMLNTALNQGSFQLSQLQQRTNSLTDERQGLQQQIAAWSAPDALSARAQQLGMVPGGTPAFLQDNGTVLGRPKALDGSLALPTATPTPAARASATATAKPGAPGATATATARAGSAAQATAKPTATATPTAATGGTAAGTAPHGTRPASGGTLPHGAEPAGPTATPTAARRGA